MLSEAADQVSEARDRQKMWAAKGEEMKREAEEKLWHHDFMNPSTSWLIYA